MAGAIGRRLIINCHGAVDLKLQARRAASLPFAVAELRKPWENKKKVDNKMELPPSMEQVPAKVVVPEEQHRYCTVDRPLRDLESSLEKLKRKKAGVKKFLEEVVKNWMEEVESVEVEVSSVVSEYDRRGGGIRAPSDAVLRWEAEMCEKTSRCAERVRNLYQQGIGMPAFEEEDDDDEEEDGDSSEKMQSKSSMVGIGSIGTVRYIKQINIYCSGNHETILRQTMEN
ncbi:uncharacterized protein [Typha angustifolia]|uniref:uncharacterized protein n=1 Tax=Typha angustifolia TaxID=59011 RepID=UPI003C2EDD5E